MGDPIITHGAHQRVVTHPQILLRIIYNSVGKKLMNGLNQTLEYDLIISSFHYVSRKL